VPWKRAHARRGNKGDNSTLERSRPAESHYRPLMTGLSQS
jgi:hypothetical protein